MHCNPLMFYTVQITTEVVNTNAIKRQTGLEMMLGHAGLAAVMGPQEDLSEELSNTGKLWVCMDCASRTPLHGLIPEED